MSHKYSVGRHARPQPPTCSTLALSPVYLAVQSIARGERPMHNSDYYREEATKYRALAEAAEDAATKQEYLELAAVCEEVADQIDDCRASG